MSLFNKLEQTSLQCINIEENTIVKQLFALYIELSIRRLISENNLIYSF